MTPYTHNDFCLLVNKSTSLSLSYSGRNQSRSMDRYHSSFPHVCRVDRCHDQGMSDYFVCYFS